MSKFLKSLCKIAIPVTLQSMLQSSFSIVDQIMIGQLGETNISAVGLCGNFSLIFSVMIHCLPRRNCSGLLYRSLSLKGVTGSLVYADLLLAGLLRRDCRPDLQTPGTAREMYGQYCCQRRTDCPHP